jgi:hypothetical protein
MLTDQRRSITKQRRRLQADAVALLGEQLAAEGMEVAEPRLAPVRKRSDGPVEHLLGRADGEGEHQDLIEWHSLLREGDHPFHDDPGLAAPRPGEYQAGPLTMIDGVLLRGVEGDAPAAGEERPRGSRIHLAERAPAAAGGLRGGTDYRTFVRLVVRHPGPSQRLARRLTGLNSTTLQSYVLDRDVLPRARRDPSSPRPGRHLGAGADLSHKGSWPLRIGLDRAGGHLPRPAPRTPSPSGGRCCDERRQGLRGRRGEGRGGGRPAPGEANAGSGAFLR